jgi:hypothetical protein
LPGQGGPLAVTAPNGGERWTGSDTVQITWNGGDTPTVDVVLLRAGAPILTQEDVPNDGALDWQVPIDLETGGDYAVRVSAPGEAEDSDSDQLDDSDALFEIRNWRMRRELMVMLGSDDGGRLYVDFPPGDPLLTGAGDSGAELRFASDVDRSEGFDLAYWIERWDAGGARVWVELPAGDGGMATFYVFWDSPGAPPLSSLEEAFPNRFETTASGMIVETALDVDAFIVHEGHTVTVTPGMPLVVHAPLILVGGTLDASGAGHGGGHAAGSGPGAGDGSPDAGGGGGAYGGRGGTGGGAFDEFVGDGGLPYGVMDDPVAEMGSGGGGGHSNDGASGGGRIELYGTFVRVNGYLFADGMNGQGGNDNCGGGGGAGGGIVLSARSLEVPGTISASGGFGGAGVPIADHSGGGGGGGGRIKLLYSETLDDSGTIRAYGGAGGEGWGYGQPGAPGSIHRGSAGASTTTILPGATTTLY